MESPGQIDAKEGPEETFDQSPIVPHHNEPSAKVRNVNLILDHSALIRGLGNVKRWVNKQFIEQQLKTNKKSSDEKIHLDLYLPLYTLHELEFLRRGSSTLASNAVQALKFIDQILDGEHEQELAEFNDFDQLESTETSFAEPKRTDSLEYNVHIEEQTGQFPTWEKCLQFKLRELQVKDFPYRQTKLAQSSLGLSHISETHIEESPEDLVQTPARLKHLIRSCVFKRYIETDTRAQPSQEHWKLVTEDNVTRVWANSFGIDCLNVNEAELLLFMSMDVTSFNVSQPGSDFNSEHDVYDQPDRGILHQRIDTTAYNYVPIGTGKKPRGESSGRDAHENSGDDTTKTKPKQAKAKPKSKPRAGKKLDQNPPVVLSATADVRMEEFGQINYAPRSTGKLWMPAGEQGPKKNRKSQKPREKQHSPAKSGEKPNSGEKPKPGLRPKAAPRQKEEKPHVE